MQLVDPLEAFIRDIYCVWRRRGGETKDKRAGLLVLPIPKPCINDVALGSGCQVSLQILHDTTCPLSSAAATVFDART